MVIKVADLPFYTEGPAVDNDGNIYCTTLSGGSILKINNRNEISEWGKSVCPNGQIILPHGDHLICDSKLAAVKRFNAEGRYLKDEIAGFCADVPIHSPNDLVTDRRGNLYFTDSIRNKGKVFFIGINGDQKILADNLDYPNGLAISSNEQYLYIAESYKNRILKIKLAADGVVENSIDVFSKLPSHPSGRNEDNLPDGLTFNGALGLLVAHYGMHVVQLISEKGKLLSSINLGMPLISNLCFYDQNTLVVTGGYGEPRPGCVFKIHI